MSYSNVLRNIIATANITQEELSNKCKKMNAPISRGQINKILNQKAKAPEENVSRAIANICNTDDRELVLEGYLEKAPKEFIEFLNIFQDKTFQVGLEFINIIYNLSNKDMNTLKEIYRKETMAKMILETLDNDDEVFLDKEDFQINKKNSYTNIIFNNAPCLKMEDNSMEGKIPKGSKLRLVMRETYKNGDIILVKVKKQKKPIIRTVFFIGRDICLCAFNNEYDNLYLKNGDYQILCCIDSIEIKI